MGGESTEVEFFQVGGGMSKFLAGGGTPPIPCSRGNPASKKQYYVSDLSKLDALLHNTHKNVFLAQHV